MNNWLRIKLLNRYTLCRMAPTSDHAITIDCYNFPYCERGSNNLAIVSPSISSSSHIVPTPSASLAGYLKIASKLGQSLVDVWSKCNFVSKNKRALLLKRKSKPTHPLIHCIAFDCKCVIYD